MASAVLYIRVSTTEQAISVEAQKAALVAYASLKGLDVVQTIVDEGVSGGVPMAKRPGGSKVLELVKAKKVDAVVGTKLDRLFRSAADCLSVVQSWEKPGVALHLVDLSLDTSTPTGKFFLGVLASTAELERGLIKERVKTALAHKKSKGERVSGKAPFGYSFADGLVVENQEEQNTLAKLRQLHKLGYKATTIAKKLNDMDVPCRGARWYSASVSRILAA